ncbi:hypothetical protein QQ045_006320 [Rhodiola kirilowii]
MAGCCEVVAEGETSTVAVTTAGQVDPRQTSTAAAQIEPSLRSRRRSMEMQQFKFMPSSSPSAGTPPLPIFQIPTQNTQYRQQARDRARNRMRHRRDGALPHRIERYRVNGHNAGYAGAEAQHEAE